MKEKKNKLHKKLGKFDGTKKSEKRIDKFFKKEMMKGYNIVSGKILVGMIATDGDENKVSEYLEFFKGEMVKVGYKGEMESQDLGDISGLKMKEGVYVVSEREAKMILLKK